MTALKKTTFTVALFLSLAGFGQHNNFLSRLADSALRLTHNSVVYDPSYYTLAYPGGDVPSGRGVCTDVIIRAFRMAGIDLQKEVHTDMKTHFHLYPKIWGLKRTSKNGSTGICVKNERYQNVLGHVFCHRILYVKDIDQVDHERRE